MGFFRQKDTQSVACHELTPSGLSQAAGSYDARHSLIYSKLIRPLLRFGERPIPVRNRGKLPTRWAARTLGLGWDRQLQRAG